MAYWKRKTTTTKVLKRRTVKRPLKRKVGVRNLTDKTAKKLGRVRKVGRVNTTDGAKRKSHNRKTKAKSVFSL